MRRAFGGVILVALLAPLAAAQGGAVPHENFARASTDAESLHALGATLLNHTERALVASLAVEHANATRGARLVAGLGEDLAVIASLSDVDSARLLAPYLGTYTRLGENVTAVVQGHETVEGLAGAPRRAGLVLLRADALALYDDADAFDAFGHDTTRLRELVALFLPRIDHLATLEPDVDATVPALLLVVDPRSVELGERVQVRGLARDGAGRDVALRLDGAPWTVVRADARGAFRAPYDVPLDARVGAHEVAATLAAPDGELRANATFDVTRLRMRLSLDVERPRVPPGGDVVLRARLTDARDRPHPGLVGVLSIDGGAAQTLAFPADGTLVARPDVEGLALGRHEARLRFAGDPHRASAEAAVTFEIALDAPTTASAPTLGARLVDAVPVVGWWPVAFVAVLLAEWAAARYVARHPELLAPKGTLAPRIDVALGRLAPLPRDAPHDDPRRILMVAYRDLLRSLAQDGEPIESMTHREVGDALARRRLDPEAARIVTQVFEEVRYAGERADEARLRRFFPALLRLLPRRRTA